MSELSSLRQDVVVVGAGAAGLTAAIASAEAGARTVVLEKAPNISRTNTSRAGGNITVSLAREAKHETNYSLSLRQKVKEASSFSDGEADPVHTFTWAENILKDIEWLTKLGLKWDRNLFTSGDLLRNTALGRGAGLNRQLLSIARSKGVKVLFNTTGNKLLSDSKVGVKGIRCQTEEGHKDFISKAVVLATSGFQANQEMLLRHFGPDFAYNVKLTGSPFSTGDGHKMTEEVGAQLINMGQFHGGSIGKHWRQGSIATYRLHHKYKFFHYSILVNKRGKRFIDESLNSHSVNGSIMMQPNQEAALIFDEKIKALGSEGVEINDSHGLIMKFNTVEELSERIGVSCDELRKTLEEFNNSVKNGDASSLNVPKRNCAIEIEAPFYAVSPVWFVLNCTLGGPRITPRAQVVNRGNIPIPGLFACGEMVGGFYSGKTFTTTDGARYYHGSYGDPISSLCMCVVYGRIAGIEAARMRGQD